MLYLEYFNNDRPWEKKEAEATKEIKHFTVRKGCYISNCEYNGMSYKNKRLRKTAKINQNRILQEDILFFSLSDAAEFITAGDPTQEWKTEKNISYQKSISIKIENISDYVNNIYELTDKNIIDDFGKRKVYSFRGQAKKEYKIIPSLARFAEKKEVKEREGIDASGQHSTFININNLDQIESNLIAEAQLRFPDIFSRNLLPAELLCLLQHYGIPTRMLDITENALVALYFACVSESKDERDSDGEVIVFSDFRGTKITPPMINAIADFYSFGSYTLDNFIEKVREKTYFLKFKKDTDTDEEWVRKCCEEYVLFLSSPIRTTRQMTQQGRYILFPNAISDYSQKLSFDCKINPIPKDHICIEKLLIIPKDKKEDILKHLRSVGINKFSLFPDSIDKMAEWIKENYKYI